MTIDKALHIYWLFKEYINFNVSFNKGEKVLGNSVLFDLDLSNDCISVEYTKN